MRTITAGELTVLAGDRTVTLRIKVANGEPNDAHMVDLTSWVEGARWDEDVDQPVAGATIMFRRDSLTTQSLSPLRTDSILNRLDDGVTYSPQLDVHRRVTIEAATTALGVAPLAGDYKLMFDGSVSAVQFAKSPISITCRDKGAVLVDTWIESLNTYGSVAGIPVEDVMDQVDYRWLGLHLVYTPVSPGYVVSPPYQQQRESLMDADIALAQLPGWDVRYAWDEGTQSFRFTFSEPDRAKMIPDHTFGPSGYIDVTSLLLELTNIRNAFTIDYPTGTGRAQASNSDSASIAKYGRKFQYIQEADTSPINTLGEAETLINAALEDLKDPKAEQEIELPFFWPVQLGDLYRFSANGVHYDTDQDWAVVSYRHEISRQHHRTFLTVRGKPAGQYLTWYKRFGGGGQGPASPVALNNFRVIAEDISTITYGWDAGSYVAEVWVGTKLFTEPLPSDPWDQIIELMAPLPYGTNSYTLNKPIEGQIILGQFEPRMDDLTPGNVVRLVVNHAPTQPPIIELDDAETATTGTQWWRVTERGLQTLSEVQTQIGTQPVSSWGPPLRSSGDPSTVRGGTLGPGEYEHDVELDVYQKRTSWIMPRVNLPLGYPPVVLGPFGFDPDKNPRIFSADVTGTVLKILCDTDTKSILVEQLGDTWKYEVDGLSLSVDVMNGGTNGVAGLGSGESATYRIHARSEPIAEVGVGTLDVERDVIIVGPTASPPGTAWDYLGVVAVAPDVGDDQMKISLKATASPAGYYVILYIGLGAADTDHTGDVSPALSAPPTVTTDYLYHTTFFRTGPESGTLRTFYVQADLLDASDVVVDSKTVSAAWYAGEPA